MAARSAAGFVRSCRVRRGGTQSAATRSDGQDSRAAASPSRRIVDSGARRPTARLGAGGSFSGRR
ncbi:hypothetical protein WG70_22270 [Burkholderia oklahomensis EO147]|nr:hypothetical protein WG70_22270 [Burkholderia oklahomensis EO147]KUY52743.1 hypothetical protein WG70_00630 [Burkholderia oklahomensis EO147]